MLCLQFVMKTKYRTGYPTVFRCYTYDGNLIQEAAPTRVTLAPTQRRSCTLDPTRVWRPCPHYHVAHLDDDHCLLHNVVDLAGDELQEDIDAPLRSLLQRHGTATDSTHSLHRWSEPNGKDM